MTRLTGKVISRPLTRVPQEGDRILWINRAFTGRMKIGYLETELETLCWKSVQYHGRPGQMTTPLERNIPAEERFELVVEYKTDAPEPWRNWKPVTVPLKYSQWQAAIDNGEVDSDKEVEFVVVPQVIAFNKPMDLAKIIPADKPKLYSKEDVRKEMYKAWYHLTMMYAPDTNDFKMQRQFDDWYNSL